MYEITTGDKIAVKNVKVDGKDWTVKLPGAGDEMVMGQGERRAKVIQARVDDGTATDEDLDRLDKIEEQMIEMFIKIFNDGSSDNASVREWVMSTPSMVIHACLAEIKEQVSDNAEDTTTDPGATGESS